MPRELSEPDGLVPVGERRRAGHALRKLVPRSLHAAWSPPASRADPVQRLIETGRHRIPDLLPIRYHRMRASPFAFLRGAAAIMAADLAQTPTTGLRVQSSGDCHHANFGVLAAHDGTPVFDLNDFDETLPAPFEWDLKRLATSLAMDARTRGLADKPSRALARTASMAFRMQMAALARLDPISAWTARIGATEAIGMIDDQKLRAREQKRLAVAMEATRKGYPNLIERTHGALRLRRTSPAVRSLSCLSDDTYELAARTAFASYRSTLPLERRLLLNRYALADVAFKLSGVGSVGTFCAIGLFATPDGETLLLQAKEAQESVLAPFAGRSLHDNQGHRVVAGQRIMQAVSDMFLGWTQDHGDDRHCYVRQLKDSRLALVGSEIADGALEHHAALCGRALARAHARSGDAARIAGYMGGGGAMDAAIADFAMAYADQTERDWRLFLEAIKCGVIEASAP